MTESIKDYSVQDIHIKDEYKDYLHRPLFDVNMRLYKSCNPYKAIVNRAIKYMIEMFDKKFHDYSEIQGVSGANLGIPFNIIAIRGTKDYSLMVMVNPEILSQRGKSKTVRSNCGSLMLDEPIEIVRRTKLCVKYHGVTLKGKNNRSVRILLSKTTQWFKDPEAFTIQHEVDHNNGITILDRAKDPFQLKSTHRGFYQTHP